MQARCLSYITVAFRQTDRLEETQRYAVKCLEVSTLAQMPEYTAFAHANQAWLAWRDGKMDLSKELGLTAVELWQQLPPNHGSATCQWLARFPLIAVALHQEKFSVAIDETRLILDPSQQRLPEALEASLAEAVRAWETGRSAVARTILNESMALAHQMHYL